MSFENHLVITDCKWLSSISKYLYQQLFYRFHQHIEHFQFHWVYIDMKNEVRCLRIFWTSSHITWNIAKVYDLILRFLSKDLLPPKICIMWKEGPYWQHILKSFLYLPQFSQAWSAGFCLQVGNEFCNYLLTLIIRFYL